MNRRDFLKSSSLVLAPLCGAITPTPGTSTIQDMIDAAQEYETVIVPPGVYSISEPIQCRPTVSLDLRSAVIQAMTSDAIHGAPQAHIYGGYISTHGNGLVFDGTKKFGMTFPTFIQGVQILGNWEAPTETGILMSADSGFVSGVYLSQVGVSYFAKGIHLRSSGAGWVNSNRLTDSTLTICHIAISIERSDGNKFDVDIQPDENCTRALYCDLGYFNRAELMVWDWNTPPAVEFTEQTAYNRLVTDLQSNQVLDKGWHNKKELTEP